MSLIEAIFLILLVAALFGIWNLPLPDSEKTDVMDKSENGGSFTLESGPAYINVSPEALNGKSGSGGASSDYFYTTTLKVRNPNHKPKKKSKKRKSKKGKKNAK